MLNSDKFIRSFNVIEHRLRKITKKGKDEGFYTLVDAAAKNNSIVRRFTDDLKEFSDLRNAIVHERTDSHVIAEPNQRTLKEIKQIKSFLNDPPKVIPMFKTDVLTFSVKDPIAKAVRILYEKSFSQCAIYKGTELLGILTSNTIARWLGVCVDEDMFSLEETSISTVLEYTENPNNYSFLKRDATIFDALETFHDFEKNGINCDAILITQSGKQDERLLGIITTWDITKIFRKING